ncbi:protein O-mannosyl-transferase TMTC1-like [Penaeus chinensis]|uniref:protein O-mannosyl-transferase TMTC1-like n=1 Tax=Penaeus chinensis TaxID=139456 RepID=UPI001FB65726|nr:protein O-mannosyl-transferase TMTC1-like [Penaeus chinensis]
MKSESAEGTSGATDGPCQDALVLEDTEEDLSSSESSCDYEDTGELKDKRRRKRRRRRRDSSGSVWSSGDLGSDALRNRNDSPPSTNGGRRAEKESEAEEKEGGRRSEEKNEEDALGDSDRTAKEKRIESDSAAKEKCRKKEAKRNRSEGDGEATLFPRRSCPPATSETPPPPPRLPARPRRPRGTHASRHNCKQGSATPVNSSGSADIARDGSKASSSRWLGRRGIPTTAKLYLVLAATSLVVYVNGVVGDYVHDDLSAVVGNPDVQGTTPLWRLLVNDFWGRPMADPASHKSYRPLTILSFRLTHWLWSHSALVDHLVNVALHMGVTVLYARTLLTALRLSLAQTLISGLAFASHPVHTEARKPEHCNVTPASEVKREVTERASSAHSLREAASDRLGIGHSLLPAVRSSFNLLHGAQMANSPAPFHALLSGSRVCGFEGRNEAAARHYEAALSLDQAHTRALKGYAALMSARDHHARAYELYTRALDREWDPDTATALAKVCILTGRLEQAHALLDRVTLLHPKHLAARVHLAQVKLQQRQYTSSEAILQEVLTEAPTHREALYHLSLVYSVTNRSDEAVGAATVAARACSDPRELCALLHAHQADLLHTLSLMEAAAMSYQIAVSLEPSLTRAHLNLGAIHHTQGRYHQALDHYRTALAQDPTNSLILENMEKLRRLMNFPTRR